MINNYIYFTQLKNYYSFFIYPKKFFHIIHSLQKKKIFINTIIFYFSYSYLEIILILLLFNFNFDRNVKLI